VNNPDKFDPTAATLASSDFTVASAWSSSPLGDPDADTVDPAVHHYYPGDPITPATPRKWLSSGPVAMGLVGALSAGAVLGLFNFGYNKPSQPPPVAVTPGVIAQPAAPASPAALPPVTNAPASTPVNTAPDIGPTSAAVVAAPASRSSPDPVPSGSPAVDSAPPPDSPPAPVDPGPPPPAMSAPVVVVDLPLPQIPPPPQIPLPPQPTPPACNPPRHLVFGVCL
jgi:hypothetical protein